MFTDVVALVERGFVLLEHDADRTFEDAAFGELESDLIYSPRIAPSMIGLGLLEAIDNPPRIFLLNL